MCSQQDAHTGTQAHALQAWQYHFPVNCNGCILMPGTAGAASNMEIDHGNTTACHVHSHISMIFSSPVVSQQAQKLSSGTKCKKLIEKIEHNAGRSVSHASLSILWAKCRSRERKTNTLSCKIPNRLRTWRRQSIRKDSFLPRQTQTQQALIDVLAPNIFLPIPPKWQECQGVGGLQFPKALHSVYCCSDIWSVWMKSSKNSNTQWSWFVIKGRIKCLIWGNQ